MDYIMRLKKGIFLASLALPMSTMAADIALQTNQIGYPSQAVKQAMICNSSVSEYSIVDAKSGTVVYKDSLQRQNRGERREIMSLGLISQNFLFLESIS